MPYPSTGSREVAGWLLAVMLLISFGLALLTAQRDPWDPDETRYLQVTHEMLERGNPFLLTFNGKPYSDKPPLYFWALALPVAVLGTTSAVAGMLPTLLCFLLLPWAVAVLARSLDLSVITGRWGGLLAVTSLLPALLGGGCRMDLPMTLFMILALAALADVISGKRRTSRRFWIFTGLGVLTKGPLALLLPLVAVLPFLRDVRVRRRLFRPSAVFLGVGIVAAWLVPATILGGRAWFMDAVVHQSAGRAVASFAHREPWWYHLATVPLGLIPWSMLVLGAMVRLASQRHALQGAGRLLLLFPFTTLVLLSVISGKTLLYPLPLYPVAALAAAWWLLENPDTPSRRLALATAGLFGLFLAAFHAFFLAPHRDIALHGAARWAPAVLVALPSLAVVMLATVGAGLAAARAAALVVPLFVASSIPFLAPGMNRLLSLRPFGAAYLEASPHEARGVAYAKVQPGFLLFTGRYFDLLKTPEALLGAVEHDRVVAIEGKTLEHLPAHVRERLEPVAAVPYRHSDIVLIRGAGKAQPPGNPSPGGV